MIISFPFFGKILFYNSDIFDWVYNSWVYTIADEFFYPELITCPVVLTCTIFDMIFNCKLLLIHWMNWNTSIVGFLYALHLRIWIAITTVLFWAFLKSFKDETVKRRLVSSMNFYRMWRNAYGQFFKYGLEI